MVRILIVKLGALGDVLRTTSLLPGLAEKFAPAELDWITADAASELLDWNPYLSRVLAWDERDGAGSYDLVIGLEDEKDVCRFASTVDAKEVIGAYLSKGRITYTPSAWFDMSVISRFGLEQANSLKQKNEKTYQQHMADLLGIKVSPYVFKLQPDEIEYGRKVVKDLGIGIKEKIVGVNTGAGKRWPQKSWGSEQTIDLVKRIRDELGAVSLILGGLDERARNRAIARETGMPETGVHSLRGFAGVVNRCAVLLSSDSLALHFGIALNKRLVVFFGPTSAAEIELYGLGEKLAPDKPCAVCYKKSCELKPNCMDDLPVGTVFQAVRRQLGAS
ncbi:MAG: glycosyltransferase family 9 protein [Candidatus Saganbacteria bacterium]|nr:glycosyltransferase family 9 protein [Candidatus Saganbacteria bacterium]